MGAGDIRNLAQEGTMQPLAVLDAFALRGFAGPGKMYHISTPITCSTIGQDYRVDRPIRLRMLVLGASRNIAVASFSPDFAALI